MKMYEMMFWDEVQYKDYVSSLLDPHTKITKFEVSTSSRFEYMADIRSRRSVTWWPWSLTVKHVNWVTGHPCIGLPSCQISASYALPFLT